MKLHTPQFKEEIKKFGRQLDSIISIGEYTVEAEDINSVTPVYNGNILKSVMKELDIDSNIEFEVGVTINYKLGALVNGEYEYLDFGNYIVYSCEKKEDTKSYEIICYDKMLYSMKEYDLNVTYPITIKDYINAICTKIRINFASYDSQFANYNKQLTGELYKGLGYTYRDVLDELAQVTASTICINSDDELEIRYINDTNDTINEEYIKDTNVTFGEKFGPINTVVFSRSADSDNIHFPNILPENPKEIKISDNQILNGNNRSDFIADIYTKLNGLEYYINDYSSTGICYYDLCDRYNVQIGDNTYSCIMLNDEINVTQGLEEIIYTEKMNESVTDYTKSDTTDKKINQTTLIVDKQNQTIESISSKVDGQDSTISTILQSVDEINQKIQEIADITVTDSSILAKVNFTGINSSEPIYINIRPISQQISYLYPNNNLKPSSNLKTKFRIIRFKNTKTNEIIDYTIPNDLYVLNENVYDEFILDYGNQLCYVNKKCGINSSGSIYALDKEITVNYEYPYIQLTDGDYEISLPGYTSGYLYIRLMASNIYTTQFATKAEMTSSINQKADSINLSVDTKIHGVNQTIEDNYTALNSQINITSQSITSEVSRAQGKEAELSSKITQTSESISSEILRATNSENSLSSRIKQTATSIDLSTSDNGSSAGINIKIKNEDGSVLNSKDANITLSGKVNFENLYDGTTTISGGNIKTGTISSNRLDSDVITTSNLSAQSISANQIKTGTLSANRISGGTINADNITVTNLNASNLTKGTVSGIPYYYNNGSTTLRLGESGNNIINGYRGSTLRWSIASFTAGGQFQTFDSGGTQRAYLSISGVGGTSDIRLKENINNIEENTSMNIITNLNPIEFKYKNDKENKFHRGLSAQQVEEILKNNGINNQIYEINDEGQYSLYYTEFIPDLINCIKYQSKQIEKMQEEIKILKGE